MLAIDFYTLIGQYTFSANTHWCCTRKMFVLFFIVVSNVLVVEKEHCFVFMCNLLSLSTGIVVVIYFI